MPTSLDGVFSPKKNYKNMHEFIPFSLPQIGDEEITEVVSTLRSGWLTTGERTARFEREFAEYTGASHALALNSCTAALHVSLAALGIKKGDEVITTPLTFCSTVNTILHVGAKPVFADVAEDGNLDPAEVAKRIGRRTRAILPVHLGGLACDLDGIWALARKHGLRVVEDAAHAVGTHYQGSHLGSSSASLSDAVAYSFYATKNMTTGEGGMVTTNDAKLAADMRTLSLHGINRDAWKRYRRDGQWHYEVLSAGFKYNLSDLQSAVGIHQLRKIEKFTETRAHYARMYHRLLGDLDEIELPPDSAVNRNAWHLYALRLRLERLTIDRAEFIEQLRMRNVGASVHFIPVPLHPFFASHAKSAAIHCPRAMALYPRLVSLPLYPAMSEEQIVQVASAVKAIVAASRRVERVAISA